MNIYNRIINILLEARVEMFIQDRLDEATPKSRADRIKNTDKKLASAKPGTGRAEQLMRKDPVTQALKTIDSSESAKKPHRVSTGGGETKTSSHITTPTSKLKRAVDTVRKHG